MARSRQATAGSHDSASVLLLQAEPEDDRSLFPCLGWSL